MATLTVHPPGERARIPASDAQAIERSLQAAYARERIEEFVAAILEDTLSPSRTDVPPWHDDAPFEADFALAVREVSEATADLLREHLTHPARDCTAPACRAPGRRASIRTYCLRTVPRA